VIGRHPPEGESRGYVRKKGGLNVKKTTTHSFCDFVF
jgi:hypothetical protein